MILILLGQEKNNPWLIVFELILESAAILALVASLY